MDIAVSGELPRDSMMPSSPRLGTIGLDVGEPGADELDIVGLGASVGRSVAT